MSAPFKKLIFVFLLTLLAGYISLPLNHYPKKFDLKLGLDLAGGSHLVFEADTSKVKPEDKKVALQAVRDTIERRVNLFGVSEPNIQTSEFEGRDRIIVELSGVSDTKEATDLIGKTAQLIFAEVVEIPDPKGGTPSAQLRPTELTGADLKLAQVTFDQNNGKPSISLQFSDDGATKFAKLTKENVGKQIPIILDNDIVSSPVVQEEIIGGQAQITGDFSIEDAQKTVIQLNAGALPVPITLVEERTVGATLGKDSITQSLYAGLVGILMVILFMVLTYGSLGFVAAVGLVVFSLISLALYKVIPITLTLPGIAGFMLSIGMAVDSNILIFERLKEEIQKRPIADALEVSFGRAWDSIRDANIATLVTAFILANPLDFKFLHVSGPVRGFAITLALGIAISLFTGIFVSRNLMRAFVRNKNTK